MLEDFKYSREQNIAESNTANMKWVNISCMFLWKRLHNHYWTSFVEIAEALANAVLKGISVVTVLGLCLLWGTNDTDIDDAFTARMH